MANDKSGLILPIYSGRELKPDKGTLKKEKPIGLVVRFSFNPSNCKRPEGPPVEGKVSSRDLQAGPWPRGRVVANMCYVFFFTG